jgi:hypothetical protein
MTQWNRMFIKFVKNWLIVVNSIVSLLLLTALGYAIYIWPQWWIPFAATMIGLLIGLSYTSKKLGKTVKTVTSTATRTVPVVFGMKKRDINMNENFAISVDGDTVHANDVKDWVLEVVQKEVALRAWEDKVRRSRESVLNEAYWRVRAGRNGYRAFKKILESSGIIVPVKQGAAIRCGFTNADDAWETICRWWEQM